MSNSSTFLDLFKEIEEAIIGLGLLGKGEVRTANWRTFANYWLPRGFFGGIVKGNGATDLIRRPPARLEKLDDAYVWGPRPEAIKDAQELFLKGVCQVQHNASLSTGPPFNAQSGEDDEILAAQAQWVLEKVLDARPDVRKLVQDHTPLGRRSQR